MFDDNIVQEVDVTNPQENENTQPVGDAQAETANSSQPPRSSESDQDKNWRNMRTNYEETKRQKQIAEEQLAEAHRLIRELAVGQRPSQPEEAPEDDSDIPTLGQTKKTVRREAEKIAREIVAQTLAEREQVDAPRRLKLEHPDFDQVVSKENIDYLKENEPELADILRDVKDQYKLGKLAYKFIKKFDVKQDLSVENMKKDAAKNAVKPVSPNAVAGRNSVGEANSFSKGLTPELRKQLNQEMIDAIRNR